MQCDLLQVPGTPGSMQQSSDSSHDQIGYLLLHGYTAMGTAVGSIFPVVQDGRAANSCQLLLHLERKEKGKDRGTNLIS